MHSDPSALTVVTLVIIFIVCNLLPLVISVPQTEAALWNC